MPLGLQGTGMDTREAIKVRLSLEPDSWHGHGSEGVWTRLIQRINDKALVEVDNIPFFSKSVSLRDKITVAFNQENGVFLDSVVERSGHSTYRVFLDHQNSEASLMLDTLRVMGCDWEKATLRGGALYALDVPPAVNIHEVYEILEKGVKEEFWFAEEGYVGHPLKDDPVSFPI